MVDANDPIICTCAEITRGNFLAAMSQNRNIEYGALLDKIGAGMKCTACRLDFELLYTDNFDRLVGVAPTAKAPAAQNSPSIKSRIYGFLDSIAPMVPLRLSNTVPVLRHADVRQFVIVCNDPPFYEASPPDPTDVRIIVRDSEGGIRADQRHVVTMERPLDVEISGMLPAAPDGRPSIGSVEVVRTWARPGKRGTTRPQILIEAPGGCGAVHTQAPNGPGGTWYTCLARPDEDRLLLAIVNPSASPLNVVVAYPFASGVVSEERESRAVSAHGAMLHEVKLSHEAAAALRDRPFGVHCNADGMHKCYLITASLALDRFAIDHPAAA